MKRILAMTATVLTVLGTLAMTSAPANAVEGDSSTSIVEIAPAPEGYWTPERMAAAKDVSLPTVETSNKSRAIWDPPPFPVETQESVVYPDWPNPIPPTVMHDGIEHPSTVGKIFATRYLAGKEPEDDMCTGTVVTSASKALIITAGHCLWPKTHTAISSNITFVPAYHVDKNGVVQAPFGKWDITTAITEDCWRDWRNSSCDQAFLKAAPRESDRARLQSVVGSMGLTIGGLPARGKTPAEPYLPHLTMHGYPVFDERNDTIPDDRRVYKCEGSSSEFDQDVFLGGIQMPCSEPITGGASGAAFIEYQPGGASVIAILHGNEPDNQEMLLAKLTNARTKTMYLDLDAYGTP